MTASPISFSPHFGKPLFLCKSHSLQKKKKKQFFFDFSIAIRCSFLFFNCWVVLIFAFPYALYSSLAHYHLLVFCALLLHFTFYITLHNLLENYLYTQMIDVWILCYCKYLNSWMIKHNRHTGPRLNSTEENHSKMTPYGTRASRKNNS